MVIVEIMEEIRRLFMVFYNKISGNYIVRDICVVIYEFLVDLKVFKRIELWIDNFEKFGLEDKVKEYS